MKTLSKIQFGVFGDHADSKRFPILLIKISSQKLSQNLFIFSVAGMRIRTSRSAPSSVPSKEVSLDLPNE